MIHGIYLKNRPKGTWHLVNIAASAEAAAHDLEAALKRAKADGNEQAEVVVQVFESSFWIPHYLHTVKENQPMYN